MKIRYMFKSFLFFSFMTMTEVAFAAIGRVAFVSGDATIDRVVNGQPYLIAAAPGLEIKLGDRLRTGARGRLQWKMGDDAVIAIGHHSEFVIREYVDSTDEVGGKAIYALVRGNMRMLSGLIGKRDQDVFEISAPNATMGVHGTIFQVFVLSDFDGSPQTVFKTDSGSIIIHSNGALREVVAGEAPVVAEFHKSPEVATPEQQATILSIAASTAIDPSVSNTVVNEPKTHN